MRVIFLFIVDESVTNIIDIHNNLKDNHQYLPKSQPT